MTTDDQSEQGDGRWLTGLSVTGAALLFLVLRLLAVTRYDWPTAFSVINSINIDDAPGVVVGTLMADVQISAAALIVLLPLAIVHQLRLGRGPRTAGGLSWLITCAVFAIALTITFRAWWFVVTLAAVTALLAFLLWGPKREFGHRAAQWLVHKMAGVSVAAALVVAATVTTPWVPLERITTRQGTLEGYVLDTPSGYLEVLTEPGRRTTILESSEVENRVELDG